MIFRTDMADERRDIYKKANSLEDEIEGIKCLEIKKDENIKVTRVEILNEKGEKALNKAKGNYITIDMKQVSNLNDEKQESIINTVSSELSNLVHNLIKKDDDVLVVGLGNENLVADALGSKVIDNIEVTRHIKKSFPEYLNNEERGISAISPGVMGVTGIETIEIIKGIVENISPKLIIAVDSLASRSIERISKSIQISDTGIVPGGGVQNSQKALNFETLGIPVIALGVPTCIENAVIVNEAINLFIENLSKENIEINEKIKNQDNYEEIKKVLNPKNFNLIVTPKEIDDLVSELSFFISESINKSL